MEGATPLGQATTAAVLSATWVASPKPTRARAPLRSFGRSQSSLWAGASGGNGTATSPSNKPKGSPENDDLVTLSRLDVGTYREATICQRLVKGTKELRCASTKLKEFLLGHVDEQQKSTVDLPIHTNRSEMRIKLFGLCKDLERAGRSIVDIVQALSTCTVGSFGHAHYKQLSDLVELLQQDVRSLSDVSWSVWRFPQDTAARSRFSEADLSLSSHLLDLFAVLRPFITHNQGRTSYGSSWSDPATLPGSDQEKIGIYDIATRITHSLRSLLHQEEEPDSANSVSLPGSLDTSAWDDLESAKRAALERHRYTDQLIGQARKRAEQEIDVPAQLRNLQTLAEFRAQASRLHRAEKRYLADLSVVSDGAPTPKKLNVNSGTEEEEFMHNWLQEWDDWKRQINSFGAEVEGEPKNRDAQPFNRYHDADEKKIPNVDNSRSDTNQAIQDHKPARTESEQLQYLASTAEDFSYSLLQLLELFEDRTLPQANTRILDRVISMADLKRFAPVDEFSARAKYDNLNIWEEPLIEAGKDGPLPRAPPSSSPTVLYASKAGKTSTLHTPLRTPRVQPSAQEEYSLRAATLNQLVRCVTSESSHDLAFVKTFITTFQSFTTPEQLWEKLMQRYNVPQWTQGTRSEAEWQKQTVVPIRLRVINFIKMWLEMHISDLSYFLIRDISDFIDGRLIKDGHKKWATTLSRLLHRQISARQVEDEAKRSKRASIANALNKMGASEFILDLPVDTIVQHLSMIEFSIYQSIKPIELLNQSWNKPKLKYRAPNVLNFIKRFNSVSLWTATNILKEAKLKQRGRLMTKFLSVALGCYAINNFNTALAIISGLNSSAIHRLKFTRAEVPEKLWTELAQVEHALGGTNYGNYRERLHSVNPPLLPYLGVYLTDLTFIEDGNPDYIGSLINFRKRELISDVLREIAQYQQRGYDFPTDNSVLNVLNSLHYIADSEKLWALSLQREPRNAERVDLP